MFYNQIKTVVLLTCLSALLLFLGSIIGGSTGVYTAFIIALIMNGIAYFFSDKIVLRLYHAKPLSRNQYPEIHAIIDELSTTMKLPKPKLWIIQTDMANAFATGRNPKHASIAVTTGILSILNERELRGVLAHELSHVKNRDILIGSVAATLATAIGYIAYMMRTAAFWGSMSNDNRRKGGNALFLLFMGILMPIAATLIQLAISRSREYFADESGAHACEDPLALASALEKLHNHVAISHLSSDQMQYASSASLFIVRPYIGNSWLSLFATHPPMQSRIARLRELQMKGKP